MPFSDGADGLTHWFGDSCNPPHECKHGSTDKMGFCPICGEEVTDNK